MSAEQHVGAQKRAHEVERAEQVREPVRLERHDAVERDDREHDRIDDGVDRRVVPDAAVLLGGRALAAVVVAAQANVQGAPRAGHQLAGLQEIGHEIGADQSPSRVHQHEKSHGHPGEHDAVGEPDAPWSAAARAVAAFIGP